MLFVFFWEISSKISTPLECRPTSWRLVLGSMDPYGLTSLCSIWQEWFFSFFLYTHHESRTHAYQRNTHVHRRWDQVNYHRSRSPHSSHHHRALRLRTCPHRVSSWTREDTHDQDPCTCPRLWVQAYFLHAWSPPLWPHGDRDLPSGYGHIRTQKMTDLHRDPPRRWDQPNSTEGPICSPRSYGREARDYRWYHSSPFAIIFRPGDRESHRTWVNLSSSRGWARSIPHEACSHVSHSRWWEKNLATGLSHEHEEVNERYGSE